MGYAVSQSPDITSAKELKHVCRYQSMCVDDRRPTVFVSLAFRNRAYAVAVRTKVLGEEVANRMAREVVPAHPSSRSPGGVPGDVRTANPLAVGFRWRLLASADEAEADSECAF